MLDLLEMSWLKSLGQILVQSYAKRKTLIKPFIYFKLHFKLILMLIFFVSLFWNEALTYICLN